MSVPASVPKRSGRHLLRRFGQSGIRNRESYSSNSTTSPIFPLNSKRRELRKVYRPRGLGAIEVSSAGIQHSKPYMKFTATLIESEVLSQRCWLYQRSRGSRFRFERFFVASLFPGRGVLSSTRRYPVDGAAMIRQLIGNLTSPLFVKTFALPKEEWVRALRGNKAGFATFLDSFQEHLYEA